MKTLIIYVSTAHGNTEKVARAMAHTLKAKLARPHEVDLDGLGDWDLIGFGSGIYAQRPHSRLLNLVAKLPIQKDKKAFLFFTAGAKSDFLLRRFTRPLKDRLLEKGFRVIGEFSCPGLDVFGPLRLIGGINKGRPNEEDLAQARRFVRSLITKVDPALKSG
jgi:flavodoxin